MGEKQIVISFSELDRIEITCKHCGIGLVGSGKADSKEFRDKCPGCEESFEMISNAIMAFRNFNRLADKSGHKVNFRIKINEEKA